MDISDCVFKEGNQYFFDTEVYTDGNSLKLPIDYEDGDVIIWKHDNKRFKGTLRESGFDSSLFKIINVLSIE